MILGFKLALTLFAFRGDFAGRRDGDATTERRGLWPPRS